MQKSKLTFLQSEPFGLLVRCGPSAHTVGNKLAVTGNLLSKEDIASTVAAL